MALHVQWKQGSKFTGSAEPAYEELERIRKKHGNLTAALVYEEAKSAESPLHRHVIDCDMELAAERHYLTRARYLIRSIEVVRPETPDKTPARAYSWIVDPGEEAPARRIYTDTAEALQDPVTRQEILSRAINEALAYRRKYQQLQELAQVFKAMDEFVEKFGQG